MPYLDYEKDAYIGESLRHHVEGALQGITQERDIASDIRKYLASPNDRKICCLYGLRRTGKTTLMLQAIKRIDDYDHCLFLDCSKEVTVMQIRKEIDKYPKLRYIFIDEITKARNFIDTCSVFSNKYASEGIKVIVTGTDSLGFFLARGNELFDRAHFLHTTYIPYVEYNKLLGKDLMDYIRYGGTLSPENVFYNQDGTASNEYSNSAIVFNIVHSLEKWNQGRNNGILEHIVANGDLPTYINKVLEYNNRLFLSHIINKDFQSHDFGSLLDLLTKSDIADPELMYPSDDSPESDAIRKEMQERIRISLNIKENPLLANQDEVDIIIKYLKSLDVLYELPDLKGGVAEYLFTQTGMRYSQASDLAEALITSEVFLSQYSAFERTKILDKMKEDICGGILEDIILYQTLYAFEPKGSKYLISKFQQSVPSKEFDMFVADFRQNGAFVAEVKLSDKAYEHQCRHLFDVEFCTYFEEEIGVPIKNKVVIYNGKTMFNPFHSKEPDNQVIYLNASEYLLYPEKIAKILSKTSIKSYAHYAKALPCVNGSDYPKKLNI